MKISSIKYYFVSIITILGGMEFYKIPLLLFNDEILIKVGKFRLYIKNLMDVWTLKEILLDHDYEKFFKVKGDCAVDIGSALGDFSIYSSKKVKRVLAFDPKPVMNKLIKKNLEINNVDNVEVYKEKVTSLNQIFKKYKIRKCDFLKVDCEGGEYQIFKNASKDTLKKTKNIAFEIHFFKKTNRSEYEKLKKKLQSNGFKLKEVENPVHDYLLFLYASR